MTGSRAYKKHDQDKLKAWDQSSMTPWIMSSTLAAIFRGQKYNYGMITLDSTPHVYPCTMHAYTHMNALTLIVLIQIIYAMQTLDTPKGLHFNLKILPVNTIISTVDSVEYVATIANCCSMTAHQQYTTPNINCEYNVQWLERLVHVHMYVHCMHTHVQIDAHIQTHSACTLTPTQ